MKLGKVIGVSALSLSLLGLGGCTLNPFAKPASNQSTGSSNATSVSDKSQGNSDTKKTQDNGSSASSDSDSGQSSSSSSGNTVQSSDSGQTSSGSQSGNSSTSHKPAPKPAIPPKTEKEALSDLASALNTKVPLMLPSVVPVNQGKYLTGTTHSETWYYKATLFQTAQPAAINSYAATKGNLIATIEATEYKDEASATASINGYTKVDATQSPNIDLGHGITAIQNAGMGHSYIIWNEGRWSIGIDSPNDPTYKNKTYPDSQKLAKDMVTYLNQYALPSPHNVGVISVNNWNRSYGTTITWQYHKMTYQVTSFDPFIALKVAVAMHFLSN